MNGEADDARGELIHKHQDSMAFDRDRFAAEQIHAPQTVFHVAEKSQPGRAVAADLWFVILGENSPHDVPVNLDAEGVRDDQRNTGAAEAWVSAFEFDDGIDEFLRRTFGTRFAFTVCRKKARYF